jgi:hypothetical protein
MSKTHRKYGSKKVFPWLIVIVGGIVLLAVAFLLTRRGAGAGTSASEAGGGTPQIVVDQQKIDYGYVKFGETRTFKVAITNKGDGSLRFTQQPYIEVKEGC